MCKLPGVVTIVTMQLHYNEDGCDLVNSHWGARLGCAVSRQIAPRAISRINGEFPIASPVENACPAVDNCNNVATPWASPQTRGRQSRAPRNSRRAVDARRFARCCCFALNLPLRGWTGHPLVPRHHCRTPRRLDLCFFALPIHPYPERFILALHTLRARLSQQGEEGSRPSVEVELRGEQATKQSKRKGRLAPYGGSQYVPPRANANGPGRRACRRTPAAATAPLTLR